MKSQLAATRHWPRGDQPILAWRCRGGWIDDLEIDEIATGSNLHEILAALGLLLGLLDNLLRPVLDRSVANSRNSPAFSSAMMASFSMALASSMMV